MEYSTISYIAPLEYITSAILHPSYIAPLIRKVVYSILHLLICCYIPCYIRKQQERLCRSGFIAGPRRRPHPMKTGRHGAILDILLVLGRSPRPNAAPSPPSTWGVLGSSARSGLWMGGNRLYQAVASHGSPVENTAIRRQEGHLDHFRSELPSIESWRRTMGDVLINTLDKKCL